MGIIYKPTPMYKSDINDMVEELYKGGPGSGIKGHRTPKKPIPGKNREVILKENKEEGWKRERGVILEHDEKRGVFTVEVETTDPEDDGLREVTEDQIEKGGPGSGVKGHTTVRRQRYSWGTMRHLQPHNESSSNPKVPVHPEHWKEIQAVHEGKKESSHFQDETGKKWDVSKHPEGGVKVKHSSSSGTWEHHVSPEQMHEDAGRERNRDEAEQNAKSPDKHKKKLSQVAAHAYERMKQKQSKNAMIRHYKLVARQDQES